MSEELKPGMHKCTVCNRAFELRKENRYTTEAKKTTALSMLVMGTDSVLYDAVDCPYCGCQQILHVRERAFAEVTSETDCEEAPEELCEKCQNCVNKDKYQDEEPCCDCDPRGEAEGFEPLKKCGDCAIAGESCNGCVAQNKFTPKESKSGKNK